MAIKDTHSYTYDYLSISSANIDAHYGPWTSIDGQEETSYKSWRDNNFPSGTAVVEGTLIAIQPTANDDVSLKIRSKGQWKDIGGRGSVNVTSL